MNLFLSPRIRLQLQKLLPLMVLVCVMFAPLFVNADPLPPGGGVKLQNPLGPGNNELGAVIRKILSNVVLPIAGIIVAFAVIYSGFLFVTAQGNEKKLQDAKSVFLWTIVGAAILLGAVAIATLIQGTLHEVSPESVPAITP